MITNKYGVNRTLWAKMSDTAQLIFNDVYVNVLNQDGMIHPAAVKQSAEEWQTVAHNAACYAAWAYDERMPKSWQKERHEAVIDAFKNEAGRWHARLSAADFKDGSAIYESMAKKTRKAAINDCECAAAHLNWVIVG